MIKLDHDQLVVLSETQLCAEHNTPVVLAWHAGEDCWTLRCGEGHYPDSLVRIPTLTEEVKQGSVAPQPIMDNIRKAGRERAAQLGPEPPMVPIGELSAKDLGDGKLLTPEQIQGIIDYAHKYGLDPYRGHVVLMYGKPYITADAYYYHAFQRDIPYSINSSPLDHDQRVDYRVAEYDHAWTATVRRHDTGGEFTGLGIVTVEEMTATSDRNPDQLKSPVVARYPWQLAQKRAEWQALRRAFPIGIDDTDME